MIEATFWTRLTRGIGLVLGQKVYDDFGIRNTAKNGTFSFKFVAQLQSVDEIAVVSQGQAAPGVIDEDRLTTLDAGAAGGRVADMTDGIFPGQLLENLVIPKNVGHKTGTSDGVQLFPVRSDNSAALLPPVLKGIGGLNKSGWLLRDDRKFRKYRTRGEIFPA